ncbi:hypothetical protein ACOSQ2_020067 [Xanthoceras sorbifolium]
MGLFLSLVDYDVKALISSTEDCTRIKAVETKKNTLGVLARAYLHFYFGFLPSTSLTFSLIKLGTLFSADSERFLRINCV